jgi:PAS domain S-box-containing protein
MAQLMTSLDDRAAKRRPSTSSDGPYRPEGRYTQSSRSKTAVQRSKTAVQGADRQDSVGASVRNRRPSYLRSPDHSSAFYDDLWRTIKAGRTFLDYLRDHRRGTTQHTGELSLVRSGADRKIAPNDPLGESRRFLSAIVESSDDAIIGQSLDGIIVSWNAGAEAVYGYGADEVMGKSISILAPADRPDEIAQILGRVARGEKVAHLETVRARKDRSVVDVSLTVSPVRNDMGDVVGVATIARDISERKQREEKTRESEERYRLLVTHTPDVIWTADAEGHCVFGVFVKSCG